MGPIGVQEMIMIFIIALVLFGPKKLPELGRMLGKALSEFRRAKNELKSTFETHLQELERETRATTTTSTPHNDYSPSRYSYPYEDSNYDAGDPSSARASYESRETHNLEPVPATPSATQDIAAPRIETTPENTPVADTVPRSNGVQPVASVSVAHDPEHSV